MSVMDVDKKSKTLAKLVTEQGMKSKPIVFMLKFQQVLKLVNKFAYLGKVKLVSMVDLMVICMSSFRWNQVTSLNGMDQPFIISLSLIHI